MLVGAATPSGSRQRFPIVVSEAYIQKVEFVHGRWRPPHRSIVEVGQIAVTPT